MVEIFGALLFGVPIWAAWEIAARIYFSRAYPEVVEAAKLQANLVGDDLDDYAKKMGMNGIPGWLVYPYCGLLGFMVIGENPLPWWGILPPFIIVIVGYACSPENQYLSKRVKMHNAEKKTSARKTKFQSHFHDIDDEDEGDFGYQESAFNDGGASAGNGQTGDREPDYASALRDAKKQAAQFSDEKAEKWAKWWTKYAQETSLPPKISLYRELVAELLWARAKGYKGTPDTSAPTEKEILQLIGAT